MCSQCRWVCYIDYPSEWGFSFIFSGGVLKLKCIRQIPSKAGKVGIIIVLHISIICWITIFQLFSRMFSAFNFCISMVLLVISPVVFTFQDINFAFSRIFHFGITLKKALMETSKYSQSIFLDGNLIFALVWRVFGWRWDTKDDLYYHKMTLCGNFHCISYTYEEHLT